MPGWHARTEKPVAEGKLKVVGVVQEQHGDRAALFMQWQQMEWPVMVDSLNLFDVRAVPITYLIDESGVIRAVNPKPDDLSKFLESEFPEAEIEIPEFVPANEATALAVKALSGGSVEEAIAALEKHVAEDRRDAAALFRLGVLLRVRFDSKDRQTQDFSEAIAAWKSALELNPGQYIWRRRIQQYGPRLDKPYSFYDWVHLAREEIRARGEVPHGLVVEPSGAEFAKPGDGGEPVKFDIEHPDPEEKLPGDVDGLIVIRSAVVESTDSKSPAFRVHLEFEPSHSNHGHWNNESGSSSIWIDVPDGWQCDRPILELVDPGKGKVATDSGVRRVEFELRPVGKTPPELEEITGSAYYFVCQGAEGVCQFLRNDFKVPVSDR